MYVGSVVAMRSRDTVFAGVGDKFVGAYAAVAGSAGR